MFSIKEIELADLVLNTENPRFEPVPGESDAIRALADGKGGEKLLRLAEDIAQAGTNPSELPIVVPAPSEGKYIVIEGNRRIACLRILADPSLIDTPQLRGLKRQFERLAKELSGTFPRKLQCACLNGKDEASHWIEIRHTGERNGAGIVKWSASQAARFAKSQSSLALAVVDALRTRTGFDALADPNFPLTTLARLVNDPDVRYAVGIEPKGDGITSTAPAEQVLRSLKKIVKDVAERAVKVKSILLKEGRTKYIEQLVKSGGIVAAVPGTSPEWYLAPPAPLPARRRSRPFVTKRKFVIPSSCVLHIKHPRINRIYGELKKLDSDGFPNSAAVVLRVFTELSVDEYIKAHRVGISSGERLSKKMIAVLDDLERAGKMSRHETQPIRSAAVDRNAPFSTPTLNAYVHNPGMMPKGADLRDIWEQVQPFMQSLWPLP